MDTQKLYENISKDIDRTSLPMMEKEMIKCLVLSNIGDFILDNINNNLQTLKQKTNGNSN